MTPSSGTRNQEPGTLIRTPNHLGDLVLSLPALAAAPQADLLIPTKPHGDRRVGPRRDQIVPLQPGIAGMVRTAATLRHRRYRRAVLLPRSLGSALLVTVAGIRERRGTATDGRRALLTEPVSPLAMDALHRSAEYQELVTGAAPLVPPTPVLPVPATAHTAWRQLLGERLHRLESFPAATLRRAAGSRPVSVGWSGGWRRPGGRSRCSVVPEIGLSPQQWRGTWRSIWAGRPICRLSPRDWPHAGCWSPMTAVRCISRPRSARPRCHCGVPAIRVEPARWASTTCCCATTRCRASPARRTTALVVAPGPSCQRRVMSVWR